MENQNNPATASDRDAKGRFLTGNSGGGRKVGSRNRLNAQMLDDLYAEWQEGGRFALKQMRLLDPSGFVKVCASLLPKHIDAVLTADPELADLLREAADFNAAYTFALQHIGSERTVRQRKVRVIEHE